MGKSEEKATCWLCGMEGLVSCMVSHIREGKKIRLHQCCHRAWHEIQRAAEFAADLHAQAEAGAARFVKMESAEPGRQGFPIWVNIDRVDCIAETEENPDTCHICSGLGEYAVQGSADEVLRKCRELIQ